jgi:hypothetical protein
MIFPVIVSLVSLAVPLAARAQTPILCPSGAQCATSIVGTCDNPRELYATSILDRSGANTMCDISALSVPVDTTGNYRICYTVYGNATVNPHDGVNVWVSGPRDEPFLDVQILPPQAVGTYPSSTGVTGCQDVLVDTPFTATVEFAFDNNLNFIDPNEMWGARGPKMPVPSWLTIEKLTAPARTKR